MPAIAHRGRTPGRSSPSQAGDAVEARYEIGLSQGLLERAEDAPNPVRVHLSLVEVPERACVVEILRPAREHFGNDEVAQFNDRPTRRPSIAPWRRIRSPQ
jgi:hypothetical protein